jgi:two-component system sensor histidine kinase CpxA
LLWDTEVAFLKGAGTHTPNIFLVLHPPYVLFATIPISTRSLLLQLMSRIALVFFGSGICCYILASYIVKPVISLSRTAEQLGDGDLKARIDTVLTKRSDELGGLSRTFNQMAYQIESLVNKYKEFLAHASHELGSPLTRLNMALGLARQKANPLLQPELDRIGYEANQLNLLVQELLLLARLESGNELSLHAASFDITSVIEAACTDARFEAAQMNKSIALTRQERFDVTGDRDLLRRALDNILRNGLRFAAHSVQIEYFPSIDATVGVISIRDDGPGVGFNQEEAIFEPFVTLPAKGTSAKGGSGLGLAIARQAILANHGTILARNSEQGGLTVRIELPVNEIADSGAIANVLDARTEMPQPR